MSRNVTAVIAVLVLVAGVSLGIGVGFMVQDQGQAAALATASPGAVAPSPSDSAFSTLAPSQTPPAETGTPATQPTGDPAPEPTALPSTEPSVEPSASPEPTAVTYPDPLTGLPVTEKRAKRRVIAVMIDDLSPARPQSGLSDAGVVWHAPAEGGIPRYMAMFHAGDPTSVGPVRSSRLYYIAWASEWRSVYVHSGGSAQALAFLATNKGRGKAVYNADEFRWGNRYLWRSKARYAPHNVYTDAKNLRKLAKAVGGDPYAKVPEPVWSFAPDAPLEARPTGGTIKVPYPANVIKYTYDRASNTYRRSVSREGKQVDAANKTRIAPKNVIVMRVRFVPTGDKKHHLDGQVTGTGAAIYFTNGKVYRGYWQKDSFTSPTKFFLKDGTPMTLTQGQTFIQVVPKAMKITFTKGEMPAAAGTPAPSVSPSPSTQP